MPQQLRDLGQPMPSMSVARQPPHVRRHDLVEATKQPILGHDLHYEVTTFETDAGPEVTHLWIKGSADRPLRAEDLRRIPLRRLAFAAARWFESNNAADETGEETRWSQPERSQERTRQHGDEHYQKVADVARSAFRKGLKVRDTVAKDFHVSPYTVDKWLRECRKRGHLRPGELQRRKNPTPTKPKKKDNTSA
jgi:hypothetical protein